MESQQEMNNEVPKNTHHKRNTSISYSNFKCYVTVKFIFLSVCSHVRYIISILYVLVFDL